MKGSNPEREKPWSTARNLRVTIEPRERVSLCSSEIKKTPNKPDTHGVKGKRMKPQKPCIGRKQKKGGRGSAKTKGERGVDRATLTARKIRRSTQKGGERQTTIKYHDGPGRERKSPEKYCNIAFKGSS